MSSALAAPLWEWLLKRFSLGREEVADGHVVEAVVDWVGFEGRWRWRQHHFEAVRRRSCILDVVRADAVVERDRNCSVDVDGTINVGVPNERRYAECRQSSYNTEEDMRRPSHHLDKLVALVLLPIPVNPEARQAVIVPPQIDVTH